MRIVSCITIPIILNVCPGFQVSSCNLDLHTAAGRPSLWRWNTTKLSWGASFVMPLNQEESSPCQCGCHGDMGPNLNHALLVCIRRIISLLYHYYTYYFKIGNCIWVCIDCRKLANQPHWHSGTSATGDQWVYKPRASGTQSIGYKMMCQFLRDSELEEANYTDYSYYCGNYLWVRENRHVLIWSKMCPLFLLI